MAKVNRFNGNIQPFAKNATGNNRTVFGNRAVQSDDINSNLNANFISGWEGGLVNDGTNDYPPMSYFNALGFTQTSLTAYLYQMGISEWNVNQEYFLHSRVMGSDGKIYKSLVGTSVAPNVGNNPTTDAVNWEDADIKDVVTLTGDQTINDVKTFLKSPIVPTPTTGFQAVNKDYADQLSFLPIGAILNGYTIFNNCIVAFGGEFNRADYPKLWAYLQANPTLVKTEADWQIKATANGGICGFFSDGNGTNTFRVPNLDKAFLRPDSRGVASYEKGSIVVLDLGLSSSFSLGLTNGNDDYVNALKNLGLDTVQTSQYIVSTAYTPASAGGSFGYGSSRPKNIAVLPLIVAK